MSKISSRRLPYLYIYVPSDFLSSLFFRTSPYHQEPISENLLQSHCHKQTNIFTGCSPPKTSTIAHNSAVITILDGSSPLQPPQVPGLLPQELTTDRPHIANMNFSEPGCATTTTTTNGSTPLHLARSLFSDMAYPTTISDFISHLTAIHDAAYLLLLPQTCRAEVAIHHAETTRISTGPLGDAVLEATTLFLLNTCRRDPAGDGAATTPIQHRDMYEATGCMLLALAAEESRYLSNLTLLLADMKGKWKVDLIETGRFVTLFTPLPSANVFPGSRTRTNAPVPSWHRTARTMGKSGIASAQALSDLVAGRATAPYHGRYLTEIAQHWRKWAGPGEARVYEEVWSYVAGRALVQE